MPATGSSSSRIFGIGHQRTRDLQTALIAVRQVLRQQIRLVGHVQALEQAHDLLVELPFVLDHLPRAEQAAGQVVLAVHRGGHLDVVRDGRIGKQPDVLERSGDAALRELIGFRPTRLSPSSSMEPAVGR